MPVDESHPILSPPKSNITLWRYMDIPSFLSLLIDESLAFIRADLFEDKYEGTLPKMTAELIDLGARKQIEEGIVGKQYWNLSEILNKENKNVYLNCWYNEKHEMVHMWKIYSKENGIAIETDYERMKESIITNELIYPTEIKYVDYDIDIIDWKANSFTVYTLKRKEYKSENEFRLILSYPRIVEDQLLNIKNPEERNLLRNKIYLDTHVFKCKVNPVKLIKKIHVSPYAPKWYLKLIIDLAKKYELTVESISQSDL